MACNSPHLFKSLDDDRIRQVSQLFDWIPYFITVCQTTSKIPWRARRSLRLNRTNNHASFLGWRCFVQESKVQLETCGISSLVIIGFCSFKGTFSRRWILILFVMGEVGYDIEQGVIDRKQAREGGWSKGLIIQKNHHS